MSTTVKKRLKACTAIIITVMMLFGILPTNVFNSNYVDATEDYKIIIGFKDLTWLKDASHNVYIANETDKTWEVLLSNADMESGIYYTTYSLPSNSVNIKVARQPSAPTSWDSPATYNYSDAKSVTAGKDYEFTALGKNSATMNDKGGTLSTGEYRLVLDFSDCTGDLPSMKMFDAVTIGGSNWGFVKQSDNIYSINLSSPQTGNFYLTVASRRVWQSQLNISDWNSSEKTYTLKITNSEKGGTDSGKQVYNFTYSKAASSLADSTINAFQLADGTVTYTFSGDEVAETAQTALTTSFTVPADVDGEAYTKLNLYINGDKTETVDLASSYSESTNTLYVGAKIDSAGNSTSYWGSALGAATSFTNKTLYLSKINFPSSASVTINGSTPQAVTTGNGAWKTTLSGNTHNKTTVVINGTTYHFLWTDTSKDLVQLNANSLAEVSGVYTDKESYKIYFDASLSKLSYENSVTNNDTMPNDSGKIFAHVWTVGQAGHSYEMTKKTYADGVHTWNDIYEYDFGDDYDPTNQKVIFYTGSSASDWPGDSSSSRTNKDGIDMPARTSEDNCYYADTSDKIIYNGGNRGGYWGKLMTIRDAESAKDTDVVPVNSGTFTPNKETFYLNASLYDYYSDYELNGTNRVNYGEYTTSGTTNKASLWQMWYTFRQFDQALSDYYRTNNANSNNTIYTGHFQPDAYETKGGTSKVWNGAFSTIANTMGLYGWSEANAAFQSNNNSSKDIAQTGTADLTGTNARYDYATQNIVSGTLGSNGIPTMYNTNVDIPYFNEAFITGANSKNAVLGEVYKNVAFPFTKVNRDNDGVMYWSFDSAATTLHLMKNSDGNSSYEYYLQQLRQAQVDGEEASHNTAGDLSAADGDAGAAQAWSKNVDSSGVNGSDGVSNVYGYFPLNDTSATSYGSKYNFGFGTKLEFDFALTEDGNVKDEDNKDKPITFNFSGDDDIWVFIDNKLVLDLGGDHGRVSGCINFSKNLTYNYQYSYKNAQDTTKCLGDYTIPANNVYVTKVKQSANNSNANTSDKVESIFDRLGLDTQAKIDQFYKDNHKLTFFYMERGQWESNMKLQFNFPSSDDISLKKEVDTSNVNSMFTDFFSDQSIFKYQVKNLATHYGPAATTSDAYDPITIATNFTGTVQPSVTDNTFEKTASYQGGRSNVLHYKALHGDSTHEYTNKRKGTFTVDSGVDIVNIIYMTDISFDMYCSDNLYGNGIYIELLDSSDNAIYSGYLNNGETYNANGWRTVTAKLANLTKGSGDLSNIAKISFVYDTEKDIYLDNFVFTTTKVSSEYIVGFTIDQNTIPDYGSAKSGQLEPAANAVYLSSYTTNTDGKITEGQVLDANGGVTVENGQTIIFKNQFRRGSYVSIVEDLSGAKGQLFTSNWTLYDEDGNKVTKMAGGTNITNPATFTNPQTNTTSFNDGRTEKLSTDSTVRTGNSYSGTKPSANTVLLRSYSNPDSIAVGTKVALVNTNVVQTGGLTIQKLQAADSEDLGAQKFKFVVEFSNIGGVGLKDSSGNTTVSQTYEIGKGEPINLTGIPVGTEYTVYELDEDGMVLTKVELGTTDVTSSVNSGTVVYASEAKSAQYYSNTIAKDTTSALKFSNKKQPKVDVTLSKVWNIPDAADPTSVTYPAYVYFSLQRKTGESGTWADVEQAQYVNFALGTDANTTLTKKITGLPAVADDGTTLYYYRFVEKTYANGIYTELAGDASVSDLFKVSYGDGYTGITKDSGSKTATVTNTYVEPYHEPIVMPETGGEGQPFNYLLFGGIVIAVSCGALLIYRRKLIAYAKVKIKEGVESANK